MNDDTFTVVVFTGHDDKPYLVQTFIQNRGTTMQAAIVEATLRGFKHRVIAEGLIETEARALKAATKKRFNLIQKRTEPNIKNVRGTVKRKAVTFLPGVQHETALDFEEQVVNDHGIKRVLKVRKETV